MLIYNILWTNVLSLWFENHTNSLKKLKTTDCSWGNKDL